MEAPFKKRKAVVESQTAASSLLSLGSLFSEEPADVKAAARCESMMSSLDRQRIFIELAFPIYEQFCAYCCTATCRRWQGFVFNV